MDIRDLPHNSAPPRSRAPYRCAPILERTLLDSEIESISETHAGPEWDEAITAARNHWDSAPVDGSPA